MVTGHVPVECVAAALKARADGGKNAKRSPTAARARQAAASRAGFGSTANFAEQDGAEGESAVAPANARGWRRCSSGVPGAACILTARFLSCSI